MLHPVLLGANFEVWAEGIFLLIMGFLWLVNRIATVVEAARRPAQPVRRPPPPVPPQVPADRRLNQCSLARLLRRKASPGRRAMRCKARSKSFSGERRADGKDINRR